MARPNRASAGRQPHRLRRRAEKVYRAAGSGLLFSVFGLGSLLLSGLILPIVNLGRRDTATQLRAQSWIRRFFALFLAFADVIQIIKVNYRDIERLREAPCLIVANHPTLLDIVVLGAALPQCDCVVKGDAWGNWFLRGIVTAAGYITNSDGSELVRECSERLNEGRSVVLFPEGTRSPEVGLGRFARGPSHIALRSGCRVLPVVIRCDPPALKKGQAWYALPNECLCYEVAVGESIYAKDIVDSDATPSIAARQVTSFLRDYFETKLGQSGA